jgi:glycerol-3-phosphate acyltransferase PlsY
MASVGSIGAAIAMTASVYLFPHRLATMPTHLLPEDATLRIVVTLLAILIILKHRSNIRRIWKGVENKI